MKKLVGLLLCGGESKRMGTDKGLIKLGNKTWAETIYDQLQSLVEITLISINPSQIDTYKELFPTQNQIIDSNFQVKGPLAGILSVFKQYSQDDFIVLACDMIDIKFNLLQEIISIYYSRQDEDFEAFVFQTDQGIQPLAAIYTSKLLEKVYHLYLNKQLQKMSLKHVLEIGNNLIINCDLNKEAQFKNRNCVEELNGF
jgi:molybdenum cofactor guanylyltransferase